MSKLFNHRNSAKRTSSASKRKLVRGFSLVELVIVVVIIAIIGAIAVPKLSRGAQGASDSALIQDLATMRAAIELYATEHGGTYPSTTIATFTTQMTGYSNVSGTSAATRTTGDDKIYGPYLKSFPAQPVGTNKGNATVTATSGWTAAAGWYYDGTTVWANDPSTDVDAKGTAYNTY